MIKYRNLAPALKAGLDGPYPDVGKVFWVVDSDYRTAAQGWSKSDGTGPLDLLYSGRADSGYLFRTGDYASDNACIQAAIDAMVDFRGDSLVLTPGNYSLAAALAINVPDMRMIGPAVGSPMAARATITDAIGSGCTTTAAADRLEVAYLQFIPLTATAVWSVVTATDRLYFHDFYYNADGIDASTSTGFLVAAGTMNGSLFERFMWHTDAAQGPLLNIDGTVETLLIRDFTHFHNGGTLAISLLDLDGAGATGIQIGPGHGQCGGASPVVTTMIDIVNMTNASTNITLRQFTGSVGYATNTTIITSAGAVNDIDIVDSWIATVEGGAGRAAYVGAV